MELAFIIWAVGTLPSLGTGLCVIASAVTICAAIVKSVCAANGVDRKDKENEHPSDYMAANLSHKALCWFIPLWLIGAVIPDKETAYQMLAAYGVQSIVENQEAKELASDGVDVLKAMLAKAKKELEEPVKN